MPTTPKKQTYTSITDHITPNAKLLIVMPFPEIEEVKNQDFFCSKGKKKLLKTLAIAGLNASSVSIVNIFPYHPRGGKLAKLSYAELKVHQEILRRKIISLNPTLILALGELPMTTLTIADKIDSYRGSVLKCTLCPSHKVLVSYDPYEVYTIPKYNYAYQYDFLRIIPNLKTRELIRKKIDIRIEENLDVFRRIFLNKAFLSDPASVISFDIECISTELVSISFSTKEDNAWVMPLHDFKIKKFCEALRLIDQILRTPVRKIAQNGNFDIMYLGYYYKIKVNNFYFDTMLAQHALYANTPKGLDFLASIYTNEVYWKDEGKQWKSANINWREFYEYNGKDSANTLEIANAQLPLLKTRGTYDVFKFAMSLCYPMVMIEMRGTKINKSLQAPLLAENDEIYRKLELLLHTLVGFPLNIKSPKQVAKYLYEDMKLPKKYKKGKVTTGEDALNSLILVGGDVIKIILLMRDYAKRGTFYNIKTSPEDRVHTTFKIGGTETGRLSSSKSILGYGSNLQNQPKRAREMYIADPEKILINADYSKAESWIVAHMANDQLMIDALNGPDFHSVNAANILNIDFKDVGYKERQIGKKISHACWVAGAEVLTPCGWAPMESISPSENIMCWDAITNELDYQPVLEMTKEHYIGDIYNFDGRSFHQSVTPNHRMYNQTKSKNYTVFSAEQADNRVDCRFPLAGVYNGTLDIEPKILQLIVAIIADGHIMPGGQVSFRLKKQRKVSRLLDLLVGREYTLNKYEDGVYSFYLPRPEVENLTSIIGNVKTLDSWVLSLSQTNLKILTEETLYWDGYINQGHRYEYITTNYQNAVWIQTAYHLTGRQSLLRTDSSCKDGRKVLYVVSFNNRSMARKSSMTVTKTSHNNLVYCPTVSTGAFLVKYKDTIMISGNSNYGVTAFTFQKAMAKDGYDFSRKKCQELLDAYFITYPKVKAFQADVRSKLQGNMSLTNVFGRKITYFSHWGDSLFRSAYSYIPQGTVGDMTNRGLKNIYDNIPQVEVMLQIHDAVLMQTEYKYLNQALIDSITECMSFEISVRHHKIKIPVDIELGPNWLHMFGWEDYRAKGEN